MIKAVLFDLDGTLLNRDQSVKQFISDQYNRLSKIFSHIPKKTYIERFIALDNHGYVWKDKVYEQLTREFNINGNTNEELLHDYIYHFQRHCVPFPQLIHILEKLKKQNMKLAMITNGKGSTR